MFGFKITTKGLALEAKLHSGAKLEITRVMIGDGKVPEETNPADLTNLISPIAQATSTKPVTVGTTTSFVVEYRNDLNGGLGRDIHINEYGVFANDPDDGEVLIYYANLGDYPEPVKAYTKNGPVVSRRYPVSLTVAEGTEIVLGYVAAAYMTADDLELYLESAALPEFMEQAQGLIDAHNKDAQAHQDMRNSTKDLDARVQRVEDMVMNDITKNAWSVDFDDLEGLEVTGVWNRTLNRIEF